MDCHHYTRCEMHDVYNQEYQSEVFHLVVFRLQLLHGYKL